MRLGLAHQIAIIAHRLYVKFCSYVLPGLLAEMADTAKQRLAALARSIVGLAGERAMGVVLQRAWPQPAVLAWLVLEQRLEGHQGPLRPVPGRQSQGLPGVLVMCVLCIVGHAS